jgi:hypothetical protein
MPDAASNSPGSQHLAGAGTGVLAIADGEVPLTIT